MVGLVGIVLRDDGGRGHRCARQCGSDWCL